MHTLSNWTKPQKSCLGLTLKCHPCYLFSNYECIALGVGQWVLGSESHPQTSCADTAWWHSCLHAICVSDAFQIAEWRVAACRTMAPRTARFTLNPQDWEQRLHAPEVTRRESLFPSMGQPKYPLSHWAGLRKFLGELQTFLFASPAHPGCLPERPPTGAACLELLGPRLPSVPHFCLLEELWMCCLTGSDLAVAGPLPPSPSSSTEQ